MEYSPLPPMIPISACGKAPPEAPKQTGDYTGGKLVSVTRSEASAPTRYNFLMRAVFTACVLLLLCGWVDAQGNRTRPSRSQFLRRSITIA